VKGASLDGFESVEIGNTKIPSAKLSGNMKSVDVTLSAKMVQAPSIELLFSFKDAHPSATLRPRRALEQPPELHDRPRASHGRFP
jgi:hypothetical protein